MGTAARPLSERVVLVVDDEDLVRLLTARILTDAGFHVLQAPGGPEALTLLSALGGAVHLLVSDIAMPEMTGLELSAAVRRDWPAVPVLLVSGHGALATGYQGPFLPKPFTVEGLLGAVSELLPPPLEFH